MPHIYRTPTTTSAKYHLRSLRQMGLLRSRRGFVNQPQVYYHDYLRLPPFLRQHFPDHTILASRDETTAAELMRHELAVSQRQTDLHLAATGHPQLDIVSEFRRFNLAGFGLPYVTEQGRQQHVEPDLMTMLRITTHRRQFVLDFCIEEDLGNESPQKVFSKLMAYSMWLGQRGQQQLLERYREAGDADPRPTLRLLLITRNGDGGTDADRLRYLYEQATRLPIELRRQVFMTTNQATEQVRDKNGILTAAIWYPIRRHGAKPIALYRAP